MKEGMMELIDSGFCSIGAYMDKIARVRKMHIFRFILSETKNNSAGSPGRFVHYKIFGINEHSELLKPEVFKYFDVFDTHTSVEIKHEQLANEYLNNLNKDAKADLLQKMLIAFVMQK